MDFNVWKMAFKKLAQVEAVGLKRAAAVSECSKQHKYISSFEQHGLPLVMESVSFFFLFFFLQQQLAGLD